MALITCPACKNTISDSTDTCPQCEHKRQSGKVAEIKEMEQLPIGWYWVIGCITVIIIFAIFSMLLGTRSPDSNKTTMSTPVPQMEIHKEQINGPTTPVRKTMKNPNPYEHITSTWSVFSTN